MSIVNKGTAYWQQLDREHHWHPFTDTKALNAKGARVITGGEGVWLTDSEGERMLDGMAGLWCVNLGYNRKELIDAAHEQMSQLPYYNCFFQTTTPPATELAAAVASVAPAGMKRVMLAGSGSEAVDTAIRMVRTYWATAHKKPYKNWIIARKNAYHGSTLCGTSVGGMGVMHAQGAPTVPHIAHVDQPYWYGEAPEGMSPEEFGLARAKLIEDKILELGPDNVAAVIGEPIQGAGGVIVPPSTYWPEVQRICRQYDVLLIADEVICGFGRTGNWFGSQTFGFEPDLMTMAKGMSSGYLPISGVAVGDRVADGLFEHAGEFYHGYTYSGHPVAAAVALKTIEIMKREKIVERVRDDIGPYFQSKIRGLQDHPLVGHVEGAGLVAGIALVDSKSPKKFFEDGGKIGQICRDHCFNNGLIMRATGSRMILSPPLIISRDEVDQLADLARKCLDLTLHDLGRS